MFSEPQGYNFNGLLIPHAAGNICIDPAEPGEVLSELMRRGSARSISPIAIIYGRQTASASAPGARIVIGSELDNSKDNFAAGMAALVDFLGASSLHQR